MRIAVLGVGLIGGSIGLAARRRLGAEVAGFDPDRANLERAVELGALDRDAASVEAAIDGVEVAFCAAPVGALPELVSAALAVPGEAVVTDVGSTKRALIDSLGGGESSERFIGGHPLAGAETSGVANARAELLEGARWYLTPTAATSGVAYDMLQRTVTELGARPQAIDPDVHDRVMATVSHLPHVLANVLVQQAAAALSEESERLPEVGSSFRDTTRVAGANPAIWTQIFDTNRDAVADEVESVIERLREAAGLIRAGDGAAVDAWHSAAAADRRRLLESDLAGGDVRELRVAVSNRPGTVAEIALALGRAQVNIEDMSLYPAPDMAHRGDLAVDRRRGRGRARGRDRRRPRPLGLARRRRPMTERFRPGGPLRGSPAVPPDKSVSHRAAIVAAMGEGETTISGYLDADDTRSTLAAVAALGAEIDGEPAGDLRIRGVGLRGARPAAIDVGNAGTPLRILPGWLAGQPKGEWTLDGDESIRRRPVDRIAEPLRRMGAAVEAREDRLPPLRVAGSRLGGIEYRSPVASAQVKSCLLLAGLLAEGPTTVIERPTRDHTERMLRAAGAAVEASDAGTSVTIHGELPSKRVTVKPAERLELGEVEVPGDFSSAAFLCVAALLVRGSELRLERVGINPGRIGLLGILTRMGAAIEVIETAPAGREPVGTIVARSGPLTGARVGAGEVPLVIDELPLVALAGCFAEGETMVAGAGELRHKESDRIVTVVAALRALGAEIEATDDGFVVAGTGGIRGGRIDSAGDHRLALLGAIAGVASEQGVEVDGFEASEVSYPEFAAELATLA